MRSVSISCLRAGAKCLYKLGATTRAFPQVVLAASFLRISPGFVSSLSERLAQLYALLFYAFYNETSLFIHTIHSPNNKYYKGE